LGLFVGTRPWGRDYPPRDSIIPLHCLLAASQSDGQVLSIVGVFDEDGVRVSLGAIVGDQEADVDARTRLFQALMNDDEDFSDNSVPGQSPGDGGTE